MGRKVFIPVTDELVFDRPELVTAPLRPYNENLACYHWLDVRLNPEDDECIAEKFNRLRMKSREHKAAYGHTVAA